MFLLPAEFHLLLPLIAEIRDVVKPETIVVMIAAGQTLSANETRFGKPVKLVRVMPNTPALVGEAMSAVCFNANITPEDRTIAMAMLNSFGKAEEVPEKLMDAVTGVSGSSPAYVAADHGFCHVSGTDKCIICTHMCSSVFVIVCAICWHKSCAACGFAMVSMLAFKRSMRPGH